MCIVHNVIKSVRWNVYSLFMAIGYNSDLTLPKTLQSLWKEKTFLSELTRF